MEGKETILSLEVSPSFNLTNAVCSHGLFMMAPNQWNPLTKTLQRPLRLSDQTTSATVKISSSACSSSLDIAVLLPEIDRMPLSSTDMQLILCQVERMLRLSDSEEKALNEFYEVHPESRDRGFGRVFRSPNLFEDMVKCILLCNCQWSRTLSMAKALCKLQLDLNCESSNGSDDILPKTPVQKETKRKRKVSKVSVNLVSKFAKSKTDLESDVNYSTNNGILALKSISPIGEDDSSGKCDLVQSSDDVKKSNLGYCSKVGDFPTPKELAGVNVNYLEKKCKLGYRAGRISKLAKSITEGKLQLTELEEMVREKGNQSLYDNLAKLLMEIDGFGPFTCSNVLMCMGFYQVIPVDSETIRHLKQVHAITCTSQTVQRYVDKVYGKYAPFQFLVYWFEIWNFYEKWFGKTSEMPPSNYQLITANNMKIKRKIKS